MTAIQVTELSLDLTASKPISRRSDVGSERVEFTQQQQKFIKEALEWLACPRSGQKLMALHGYAGSGKSFTVNHLLAMARQSGLLVGDIWATAPTHQAKKILEQASRGTGSGITEFMTSHSFFGLRPQKVEFKKHHEEKLDELQSIADEDLTPDQHSTIDALIWRKNAELEGLEEFLPTEMKKGAEHVRLVVVDEFSMINETLARLYFELPLLYDMHPDLQILFLGDPAQLPPVKEKESLISEVPRFTPLTEVVRNKGNILKYCTEVRTAREESLSTLHYKYDSDDLLMMSQQEVLREIKGVMDSGESVRFLAGTNERCREVNEMVRYALKGVEGGLTYCTGDVVLTLSAVKRGIAYRTTGNPGYGPKCDGDMQDHTSTLFELGDELKLGDYVACGNDGGVRLDENSFSFRAATGNVFHRKFFRYRPYDSGDEFTRNNALCLVNPDEYKRWVEDCELLWARARTTQTRSKKKGARGQSGDAAKEVWKELGLKNWDKRQDGSALSYQDYKKIRSQLWVEAFLLRQFSDKASFSYTSTVHRAQGITSDVAILDERTLMKSQMGRYSETFDLRKLIYTAASRARKQLIIMV